MAGAVPIWEGMAKKSSRTQLNIEELIERIQATYDIGLPGVVIFSFKSLNDEDFKAIREVMTRIRADEK